MAALTWRDVAAPDLGTSLQGINQFSNLLSGAFNGVSSALGRYDNNQDELANRAILERSLAIQDPESYRAAIASGSILGADANRASASTLAGINSRVGDLQNQALGRINLDNAQRTSDQSRALDSVGAAAIRYQQLAQDSSPAGQKAAADFLAANPGITDASTLGYRNALGISKNAFDAQTAGLANANTRQAMDLAMRGEGRQADLFGREKTEWTEGRAAQTVAAQAYADGISQEDLPEYMVNHGISGPAAVKFLGLSSSILPANIANAPGGGGAGGGGTVPGAGVLSSQGQANTNFADVKSAIMGKEGANSLGGYGTLAYNTSGGGNAAGVKPPKPLTQMTMGEVYDFQRGPMRAATKGFRGPTDVGSTGAGAYQLESETLKQNASQVFGANWRDQPFSAANQDKVAENLFNAVKGNPQLLANTWAAFNNRNPSAGNPVAAQAAVTARTRAGTNQRISDIGGANYDEARAAAKGDLSSSSVDVAAKLKSKFPDIPQDKIVDGIRYIQQRANAQARAAGNKSYSMGNAEAGVIFENSTQSSILPNWIRNRSSSAYLNDDAVDTAIARGIAGTDQDAVGSLTMARGNAAARDQSSAALATARNNLIAAQQRVRDPATLARYQRIYDQAAAQDALNQGYEGNNNPIESYGTAAAGGAAATNAFTNMSRPRAPLAAPAAAPAPANQAARDAAIMRAFAAANPQPVYVGPALLRPR